MKNSWQPFKIPVLLRAETLWNDKKTLFYASVMLINKSEGSNKTYTSQMMDTRCECLQSCLIGNVSERIEGNTREISPMRSGQLKYKVCCWTSALQTLCMRKHVSSFYINHTVNDWNLFKGNLVGVPLLYDSRTCHDLRWYIFKWMKSYHLENESDLQVCQPS